MLVQNEVCLYTILNIIAFVILSGIEGSPYFNWVVYVFVSKNNKNTNSNKHKEGSKQDPENRYKNSDK